MPTALVTGSLENVHVTALTLKTAGFEVFAAEPDEAEIPTDLCQVDCYVQLPIEIARTGDDALARAHSVVTHALSMRFDAAAQIAPLLAPGARVVLVTDWNEETPIIDMNIARPLIEAIIADHGGRGVRVAVIAGPGSQEEIIAAAQRHPPAWTAYATIEPDLPFTDWRNEIICQSSLHLLT